MEYPISRVGARASACLPTPSRGRPWWIRTLIAMALCLLLCLPLGAPLAAPAAAQVHEHGVGDGAGSHHRAPIHFTHPLIAESVSPDTKARLSWRYADAGEETETEFELEGEWAFFGGMSVEVALPYVRVEDEDGPDADGIGKLEVALKFANFAFADGGILLGYGLEVGLPTGDDEEGIGSDHIVEYEPFFNLGFQRGGLELVGWAKFGIPTRQVADEEVETEFGWNALGLYRFPGDRIQMLLELDGERGLSGGAGENVVNVTPGLKVKPFAGRELQIGVGVGFPLDDEEFDARIVVSAFHHF